MIHAIGFNAVWIVYLGKKNGLFRSIALSSRPITPVALAEKMNLFAPAVRAWCHSAVCIGYLSEKKGKVFVPPGVKELVLNEESPYYIAGQFMYSGLRSLEYGAFDDLFSYGKAKSPSSLNTMKAFEEVTSWDHYAFLNAIKTRNRKLHRILMKGCAVLDVGCGAGKFMQRMITAYPRCEFTGIDPYADRIDTEKQKARDSQSNFDHKDLEILKASGENMDFQEQFDLVYFGESLYLINNKQKAIRNSYNALKGGGTIAILEGLLPVGIKCGDSEESKMIITMQLDFVLQGHEFMSKKEVISLLKQAGFMNVKLDHLGVSFYLVTATKPLFDP
ncbi:MAG TPA: class I SAM-dependent methyltransferase [Nitrososphaera sp.]|nr:class I SAM-dependent methyltransferase [Nitrososphaera sp.]